MVGEFDNQGILRINDLAYEESKMNNESARNANEDFSTVAQKVENLEKLYGNTKLAKTQPCTDDLCKYQKGYYNKACEGNSRKECTYCSGTTCYIYGETSNDYVVYKSSCDSTYSVCRSVNEYKKIGNTKKQIRNTQYNSDGKITSINENTYDENGVQTGGMATSYDAATGKVKASTQRTYSDGKQTGSTSTQYDIATGNVKQIDKTTYSSGKPIDRTITDYDITTGNVKQTDEWVYEDGVMTERTMIFYNVNTGKKSQERELRPYGNFHGDLYTINYASDGETIRQRNDFERYSDGKTKTQRITNYQNGEPSNYNEYYRDTDGSTRLGSKSGCNVTTNVCTSCTGSAAGTEGCP